MDGIRKYAQFPCNVADKLTHLIHQGNMFVSFAVIYWTSRKGNEGKKVIPLPYKPRSERKGRL